LRHLGFLFSGGLVPHLNVFKDNGVPYLVEVLWELAEELPIFLADVPELWRLHRHELCFRDDETGQKWTPDEFVNSAPGMRTPFRDRHWLRLYAADPLYPILLHPEGWVADGLHRLIKAHLENRPLIAARQFPVMPEAARLPSRCG
jgi:hypothetical protein